MNQWENTVITDKGLALMAKLAEGVSLRLSKAVAGSGYVTPVLLTQQTAITSIKQTLKFKPVSYPENGKCAVPVILSNEGLAEGYTATQVGVYAVDPDAGEILFLISQAATAQNGTIVPSATEMPSYSAEWTFYVQYGRADGISLTVDPANTVSRQEMEQHVSEKVDPITDTYKVTGEIVTFDNADEAPLHALRIYGKTTQDGTPTPENPVELVSAGASGAINTTVVGKNIFGGDALADKLVEVASATKDTTAGTVNFAASIVSGHKIFENFEAGKQYTIILYGINLNTGYPHCNLALYYDDGSYKILNFKTAGEYSYCVETSNANKNLVRLGGFQATSRTILHYDKCGIFEGVLTEADFEPFIGSTLTASTPNGLPGYPLGATIPDIIKASDALMAGVWWDEKTQQYYISDTKDSAKGVYVQRIGLDVFDGTENLSYNSQYNNVAAVVTNVEQTDREPTHILCSHFKAAPVGETITAGGVCCRSSSHGVCFGLKTDTDLTNYSQAEVIAVVRNFLVSQYESGNPVIVIYVLAEPIETPLSAEEMAQYAALHSYKPTTTVYNDAGAHMEVEYYKPNRALLAAGGKVYGTIDMTGNRITGLATPTKETDAVPKAYVDGKITFGTEDLEAGTSALPTGVLYFVIE